jgi:hypothetical protein
MADRLIFKCIKCDKEVDMTICSNCGKGKYIGKSYTTSEFTHEIAFECPICKDKWNYFNCSCGAYNSPDIVKKQAYENGYISKAGCYVATYIYQNENDNRIILLKKIRDNFCYKSSIGRRFVHFYYNSYPVFIRFLKNNRIIKAGLKYTLNFFCKYLKILYR